LFQAKAIRLLLNCENMENKGFGNIQDWLNAKWLHFEVNAKYGYISPVILYKQINNIKY